MVFMWLNLHFLSEYKLKYINYIIVLFPAAYLLSAMDTTANPCENFFQYACGTWNKIHIIPEDRSSISTFEVSYLEYTETNVRKLKDILMFL